MCDSRLGLESHSCLSFAGPRQECSGLGFGTSGITTDVLLSFSLVFEWGANVLCLFTAANSEVSLKCFNSFKEDSWPKLVCAGATLVVGSA